MILKTGETRELVLRDCTVDGINVKAKMTHTTAATAFSGEIWDLEKVNCTVILKRKGQADLAVYSDILKPWAYLSGYYSGDFTQIVDNEYSLLLVQDTGVKEIALQTLNLKFGGVFNLKGDDELVVKFTELSSFASTVDTSVSFIEFDECEAIGYEYGTPQISTKSITASESRVAEYLGDDVKAILFANFDKTGVLSADTPITSINISSDRLSVNDNYIELLAKRSAQFQDKDSADKRDQSFMLFSSATEIDNAKVELNLVSGNVTSGNNYIVVQRLYVTPDTVRKAARLDAKHEAELRNKIANK